MISGKLSDASIEQRKMDHIAICLEQDVHSQQITTGLEQYRFLHNALPELDFAQLTCATSFLKMPLRAPFLISSMTGGTKHAAAINERLATVAEHRGWALGLGSIRAAIENEALTPSFQVRDVAPHIPLLANLGAVQLNYGFDVVQCQRAMALTKADALVLHLNSLQEVFQLNGNTNFSNLLRKIECLCEKLDHPVGVKEVGWGIDGEVARQLVDAGVDFIDIAGAGGTSWSQVEKQRLPEGILRLAADSFADWGIPTAECIEDVRHQLPSVTLIASGGMHTGVEAAKAIALGADFVGFGRSLLASAIDSIEQLDATLARIEMECKLAMWGIGAEDLVALKHTRRLIRK